MGSLGASLIYRVIQEGRSAFGTVIVLAIARKKKFI
jgi:hypothetical protein